MSSSFPYLAVERRHKVPYGLVLWLVDTYEDNDILSIPIYPPRHFRPSRLGWSSRWYLEPWATATAAAWMNEKLRRRNA